MPSPDGFQPMSWLFTTSIFFSDLTVACTVRTPFRSLDVDFCLVARRPRQMANSLQFFRQPVYPSCGWNSDLDFPSKRSYCNWSTADRRVSLYQTLILSSSGKCREGGQ